MTVKIPFITPVPEPGYVGNHRSTPAWANFWNSVSSPYATTALHNEVIAAALKEWGAVILRSEGMIEFESQEKAVLWLLRWS